MRRKSNIIWNVCINSRYYSRIAKDYIIKDMSTLKIYNKKERKNILNFFMFTFLIWILQCSNNWNSCRSWHCENDLNVLNLGEKRSLAENKGITKQRNEGLKLHEEQDIIEVNLDLDNKKIGIEEDIDTKQENEQEEKKNKKLKLKESILGKCRNYFKLTTLSIIFLLSFSSLITIVIDYINPTLHTILLFYTLSKISILIFSTLILYEQIQKKRNNKS
ncbi:fam-h protein [Plasmodium relictum]|uniref:Fam-h protein n=1 Tax=Plasmodium relictum TaxID=85471 RepID=A0A1J1GKC5_PLARL|nr:fam-h protein [Plasmodium relictum]CRG84984.1 fam-h protein [Plasmodium relictum]